jgi:hypothetical protein
VASVVVVERSEQRLAERVEHVLVLQDRVRAKGAPMAVAAGVSCS